jgi:hypothetical protein
MGKLKLLLITLVTTAIFFGGFVQNILAQSCNCSCQPTDWCSIRLRPNGTRYCDFGDKNSQSGTLSGNNCILSSELTCALRHGCEDGRCIPVANDIYRAWNCTVGGGPPTCTDTCGCTPSSPGAEWIEGNAPANYIPACVNSTSCDGKRTDCSSCGQTKYWYKPNPMLAAPSSPINYEYCINGSCTTLSNDPNNPTIFNLPTTADNVFIRTNTPTVPELGRGLRYKYQLNNLSDGFNPSTCGNGTTGFPYDRCQTDIEDRRTWGIANLVNTAGLDNPSYSIKFNNGVLLNCTADVIYENSNIVGYFKYNKPPIVKSISKLVSLSGTETDSDNATTCSDNNPFTFTITYSDPDGNAELSAMRFWIDTQTPSASRVNRSIHAEATQVSNSIRLTGMTCNSNGTGCGWNLHNPNYNSERSLIMVGSGFRDLLPGQAGADNPIGSATITDIVRPNSTDIQVTFKVWIDDDISNPADNSVKLYAKAVDIWGLQTSWPEMDSHIIDFDPPVITMPSDFTIIGGNSVRVDWSVTDAISGVSDVWGHADYLSNPPGSVSGPISHLSPTGTKNYRIDDPTETRPLWRYSGNPVVSGQEEIDLQLNIGNIIGFKLDAVDRACNLRTSPTTNQSLGDAWLTSKGGNVYSAGGTDINPRAVSDDGFFLTRDNSLWDGAFRVKLDDPNTVTIPGKFNDIAPSTGFYSVGVNSIEYPSAIDNPSLGFALINYSNSKLSKPLYNELFENSNKLYGVDVAIVDIGSIDINTGSMSQSSQIPGCEQSGKKCLVRVNGNLSIQTQIANKPFVCDKPTVFLVSENVNLQPNILKGTDPMDGCMVLAKGTVSINTGQNQLLNPLCNTSAITNSSICYPAYDILELFIYTDGEIIINDDPRPLLSEGLLVRGSLLAIGEGTNPPAIKWGRTLQLVGNGRFPSIVAHYDPVYLGISRGIFYFDFPAYSVDVGYKSGQ